VKAARIRAGAKHKNQDGGKDCARQDRKGRTKMKSSKLFCAALLIGVLASGFMAAGCASLNNLLNPIHAIDGNGEKIAATWNSSTRQCTIGGAVYPYQDRPAVPAAPQKPAEPIQPSPPSWTRSNIVVEQISGSGADRIRWYTKESFSSREEAIKKINFYLSQGQRNDISPGDRAHYLAVADNISLAFKLCEQQQKQYDSQLAQYQANLPKYQQDIAQYNKDIAAYQAKLPEYQARVDAEIKSIQDSINPTAPGNWVTYVEDKYLLYKGKAE
jgi:hypothetical protein